MIIKELTGQIKWVIFALVISFVLVCFFDGAAIKSSNLFITQNTFLGLNLFLEILIFSVFSTFVVFGIKGYFEMYSQKTSNVIIFLTGAMLTFVIFILSCQILLQE
ncbi:hypothetical protein [Flavobacterium algicola]|uniref:hypothetical protein n=1 Tax=Flavobacterium algicola TaxID=556529 RepID=UPI001EFDC865|nr:hypothetical protein [Flavobacterium algicola]MCG9794147.1 hypothetical protein [Flavobacterium algicola]